MDGDSARFSALNILRSEVFSYIKQQQYEAFLSLARRNSLLLQKTSIYFQINGAIYPDTDPDGNSVLGRNLVVPALDYSLRPEFQKIISAQDKSTNGMITNFFRDVLAISQNGMVLDALLPDILVLALKKKLGLLAYQAIDGGSGLPFKPNEMVQANMDQVMDHYRDTVLDLREMLMDKLLME